MKNLLLFTCIMLIAASCCSVNLQFKYTDKVADNYKAIYAILEDPCAAKLYIKDSADVSSSFYQLISNEEECEKTAEELKEDYKCDLEVTEEYLTSEVHNIKIQNSEGKYLLFIFRNYNSKWYLRRILEGHKDNPQL